MNDILEIRNISVFYNLIQALSDINIAVRQGEIVCLLGPNAAGKSTLMFTVAGILSPRKGEIVFNGRQIHNLPCEQVVREGITLVPEGRLLFDGMKITENLELGAYRWYKRKKRAHVQQELQEVYGLFPVLKSREKQLAGMLSGGEQQMVAIGRAIMSKPRMLLLDEPSLGLAPILVHLLMETLSGLRERRGLTIFFSEQNAVAALEIADRGYIMSGGKIVTEGKKDDFQSMDRIRMAYFGNGKEG